MTKKELSQLYYLKKEIKEQQRKLFELEVAATNCAAAVTGLPTAKGTSDKVGNYAAQIADLKARIEQNLKKRLYEFSRLNSYIDSIDDIEIKLIFSLRYMHGMSWQKISESLGMSGDGSTERKKHDRFLKLS